MLVTKGHISLSSPILCSHLSSPYDHLDCNFNIKLNFCCVLTEIKMGIQEITLNCTIAPFLLYLVTNHDLNFALCSDC